MGNVLLMTASTSFRKARSVNQTSASYVSKLPTATEPTGDAGTATGSSVIELVAPGLSPGSGSQVPNVMLASFFGEGANNSTFSARLVGWRPTGEENRETMLWIPVTVVAFTLTLSSTPVGVSGKVIDSNQLFADTIALVDGNDDVSVDIVSPEDDTIAHAVIDLKGFRKVEWTFATGGSATSCNALYSLL